MVDFSDLGAAGDVLQGHYGAADDRRNGFYIPVLSRATHYDRVSGYFTSAGLAAAAQGLATFLPGGGTMRLVVGAQLSEADVAAVSGPADLDEALASALSGSSVLEEDLGDVIHQRYREVLTWMVAAGRDRAARLRREGRPGPCRRGRAEPAPAPARRAPGEGGRLGGGRCVDSGWSPAERVIVDVRPTEDGFVYLACRAPYRGRPISPLYPSQILGPAPVKENP